jgi:restriction system protein
MIRMWMVRAERGRLYDAFLEHGVVALGWTRLAPMVLEAPSRDALVAMYAALEPSRRRSAIVSGASQMWRFAHEMVVGDRVVTYSPQRRTYRVGRVTGPARHRPDWNPIGLPLARTVDWAAADVPRDALPASTRNRLGPTLTLFRVAPGAARQLVLHVDPPSM